MVVDALRRNAREFDVVTRCENAEFALLMPDPGHDAAQRVLDLARAVSEDVTRDERINTPQRIALAFGYAVHGKDGHDAQTLLARARDPRIHMVKGAATRRQGAAGGRTPPGRREGGI